MQIHGHNAARSRAADADPKASQGPLLMIPNLYKIAGELTSTVFHVAARTIATQGRPDEAKRLLELAKHDIQARYQRYEQLAGGSKDGHA